MALLQVLLQVVRLPLKDEAAVRRLRQLQVVAGQHPPLQP